MNFTLSKSTLDNLLKYDVTNVKELLNKLVIEIKIQELRIESKKKILLELDKERETFYRLNSKRDGLISAKRHFSNPQIQYEKKSLEFKKEITQDESKLMEIKDTKKRVILNQSLRGNKYNITTINDIFNFNVQGFPIRPSHIGKFRGVIKIYNQSHSTYWISKMSSLISEKSRLETELSKYKNITSRKNFVKPVIAKLKPIFVKPVISKPVTSKFTIGKKKETKEIIKKSTIVGLSIISITGLVYLVFKK